MKKIEAKEIDRNMISLIGEKWMLITAGNKDAFNTMTANWGSIGYLWNKPVAFIFVRPERYTFEFTEDNDFVTLSFFDEKYRDALKICGSKSGRHSDKLAETDLTPHETTLGNIAFKEAEIVLECRKIYGDFLDPEKFTDVSPLEKWYGEGGMHKMYILEIVNAWIK